MADDDFQVAPTTETTTADPVHDGPGDSAPAKKAAAKKAPAKKAAAKKAPAKKATAKKAAAVVDPDAPEATEAEGVAPPAKKAAAKKASSATKKTATGSAKKATTGAAKKTAKSAPVPDPEAPEAGAAEQPEAEAAPAGSGIMPLFQAPETTKAPAKRTRTRKATGAKPAEDATAAEAPETAPDAAAAPEQPRPARKRTAKKAAAKPEAAEESPEEIATDESADESVVDAADRGDQGDEDDREEGGGPRRRRRRGGRRRRKTGEGGEDTGSDDDASDETTKADRGAKSGGSGRSDSSEKGSARDSDQDDAGGEGSSRRRRRRRRTGEDGGDADDSANTVTRVRRARTAEDEITAVSGSTRLEAKKQRRREGREAGRRRAPIVSEAEFLARRESVDRVMVIRQTEELTQIGVLEDKVLVEHYVARESQTSLIGNVYLGRVQNVLPSMEAAFIDIGKGRNAVLYAGEVNWSALGHREGQPRKIESVLSSGQSILVQVTKDPIGHKGARLTSQVSLAGRFLVYVPDGTTSGISRKLPDTERARLKALLKEIVPETAGVIVRTAAEGASEEELTRDVERLKARWEDIEGKLKGNAPQLLYGEPDLTLKVVRDLFTEDFSKLVIQGDEAWETVTNYVAHVAPDLQERVERYPADESRDIFAAYRVDEQIAKGLDRKVWLPSGGSLVIDRTEAMTVVDVNTGKFTGSGGNLEETVTKNNLEAAEEMVRQLRLRDIGGIIVIDFIDMVLESNRDLVLRRLVECLGRDRTRHQVAEVTSLGLVQMTRKRIGTGLVESFSEPCDQCHGRGVVIRDSPVEPRKVEDENGRGGRRGRGGRGRGDDQQGGSGNGAPRSAPTPKDIAAMPRHEHVEAADEADEADAEPRSDAGAPVEVPAEAPSHETAPPKVVTRSRRRGGAAAAVTPEPGEAPESEPAPASQTVAPPVAEPDDAPEVEAPGTAEASGPSAPEPPRVVTRTRSSRRVTTPVVLEPAPMVLAATPGEGQGAPEPAEPPTGGPPAAPEPPRVVTRTRGRSASRPAGPPTGGPGSESADGTGTVEHVPVKKKGSRKR